MKKYVIFLLVILLLILSTIGYIGITSSEFIPYTEDYLEQYRDFLQYSLGDFELLHEGTGGENFFGTAWEWQTWHVQFVHQNGEENTFFFSNHEPMGLAVARHAEQIGNAQLTELTDAMGGHLAALDHVNSISISLHFQGQAAQLTDPQSGLRLSYPITWQTLLEDWDFMLRIAVRSRSETYPEALAEMKELVRALAHDTEQDQIEVHFTHWSSDESSRHFSRFQYDRQADMFLTV